MAQYMTVDGSGYAETPDAAQVEFSSTDLDIQIRAAATDWTPAGPMTFGGRDKIAQTAFYLNLTTTGFLQLSWTADGSTFIVKTSTASLGFTDATVQWVRCTLDIDNGAAGNDVKFYTGGTDTTPSWAQLGSTVTTAGTTSIYAAGTAVMQAGARRGIQGFIGDIYEYVAYADLTQTDKRLHFNANDFTVGDSATDTAVDVTGLTWTLNGTAVIAGTPPASGSSGGSLLALGMV